MTETAQQTPGASSSADLTFRELYEGLGVAVWIRDASAAKARIESLRAQGVHDFADYFDQNPEAVSELSGLISTVDYNTQGLRLFGAETAEQLREHAAATATADTPIFQREAFIAMAAGERSFRRETVLRTLQGRDLACLLSLDFGPRENNCRCMVVTITDISEQKNAQAASAALAAAGRELSASLDYEETLQSVARVLVPDFADWCAVDLLQKDGQLNRLAVAHVDPGKVEFARELQKRYPPDPNSEIGVWKVIRTGRPEMMSEIPQALIEATAVDDEHLRIIQELQLHSFICAPLTARGGLTFGAITLVRSGPSRGYADADLQIAMEIAARASNAIDNAWLHSELQVSEQRLRDAIQALPAAMYVTDVEGRITLYNEAAVELWGRRPDLGEMWCGSWRIFTPDGAPVELDDCPMARTLHEGRSIRYEIVIERPDGSRVPAMPYPQPLFDAEGNVTGAINMIVDLSESKRAEETMQRRLRQIEVIYRLSTSVAAAADVNEISEAALDGLIDAVAADKASVLLYDDDGVMRFKGWRGLSDAYRQAVEGHTPWGPDDADAVPITVEDVTKDKSLAGLADTISAEGIRALAFIPLVGRKRLLGKFMVYFNEPHDFTKAEVQICQTIAGHVSHALERNRAEADLIASEERYRAVVDSQTEMLCRFHPDGKILFVNAAYAEAFGSSPEELIGRNFWGFIPREDHADLRSMLDSLTPQSPMVTIENRLETVEGVRWTLWTNRALRFSKKGRVTEAQSSGVDITDRKRAEEALRQSEERFRGVVEAAPNGIILVDTEGRIVMANPEAERALGYEPGELGLQPVETLVPERFRDGHHAWRASFLHDPATRPMGAGRDLYARRKDGTEFPVEIGLSPLSTPQGMRILATIVDITERKRAEEDMQAAAALKDQFLGLVSHELRTPIATVSGNSKLLLRRGHLLSADDHRQALEDIAHEAGRLQSIIENLLILSRIDGSNALHFEPVALHKLASHRVEAFTRRSPSRRIDFYAADSAVVEGEANLLAMVIDNLIANADKYSPRSEPIELALRNGGADVEVAVRDHGIGVDETELQELFEPFYRGSSGRDLAKGMGLGLATCKRIVEAHGGRIWASRHPEGGAEFTFVLPVVKTGPVSEEENVAAS